MSISTAEITVNILPNIVIPAAGINGAGEEVVCTRTVSVGEALGATQQLSKGVT